MSIPDFVKFNSEKVYRAIFNQAGVGVAQLESATGRFTVVNDRYCEITGYDEEELLSLSFQMITHPDDLTLDLDNMVKLITGEIAHYTIEKRYIRKDQTIVWVELTVSPMWNPGEDPENHIAVVQDITVRKLHETWRMLSHSLLKVLNRPNDWRNLVRDLLMLIKEHTGFESVGIRLKDGDDYPYYEQNGYRPAFVEAERTLCKNNPDGSLVFGSDGKAILDCMCGTIIEGQSNPSWDHVTANGTFWTNHLSQLVQQPGTPAAMLFPRGMCVKERYETVILIPLHSGGEAIGLLQLMDHRKNQLSPQMVAILEELSSSIGVGFRRISQESQLREKEEQFRMLFENDPSPRWVYDLASLAFIDVNKSAVEQYGYSKEEFLRMTLKEIRPAAEVPGLLANVMESTADKQSSRGWHHVTKNGEVRDVEITSYASFFNGKNARVVLARDVTEKLKNDRELRETKEYLQKLLDNANAPIITWNPDQSIRAVNHAFERLTGYLAPELSGRPLEILFPNEQRESIIRLIRETADGENWDSVEIPICRKDKEVRYLLWSSANIYNDHERMLIATIAQGNDITERRRMEEELMRKENLLSTVIDLLPVGVWISDAKGTIVRGNRAGLDIWGGARFVGPDEYHEYKGWWRSSGIRIESRDWAAARAVERGETSLNEEIDIESFVGKRKIILNSAIPIRSDSHEILGAVIVNQDITERELANDHIRQVNMALEEARAMAVESDRLKTFLLQNLSHEFRTPMNAILGFSSLIEGDSQDDESRHMASRIRSAADRLMKTLDDILVLSQLQALQKTEIGEVIDPYTVLLTHMPRYAGQAQNHGLSIELNKRDRVGISIGIEPFLQMVNPLIDNAIKFTPSGSIGVTVGGELRNGIPCAVISICDTGIGISPEQQSLIFDAFRQVSEGYGRRYEGTGLGLTISRKIAELHNGIIELVSGPGEGSTFTLILPAVLPENSKLQDGRGEEFPRTDVAAWQPSIQHESNTSEPPKRILVVEDNPDNVCLIQTFLRGAVACDSAHDAEMAIYLCRERKYDVILLDINLGPGMDGLEAMGIIRSIPGYKRIPVIAATGYTEKVDQERITLAGCQYYLGKPFTSHELNQAVRRALQKPANI